MEPFLSKNLPIFLVTGIPGVGVTRISYLLRKTSKFTIINIKDSLKSVSLLSACYESKQINYLMEHGRPIPNEIVLSVIKRDFLSTCNESTGYIIEGFPLNLEQAKAFERLICPFTLVICLSLNLDGYLARIFDESGTESVTNLVKLHYYFSKQLKLICNNYKHKSLDVLVSFPFEDSCNVIVNSLERFGFKFRHLFKLK